MNHLQPVMRELPAAGTPLGGGARLLLLALFSIALSVWGLESEVWAQGGGDARPTEGIKVFELLLKGQYFMIPIVLLSLLVVTFTFERLLGLRRSRILPREFVTELGRLGNAAEGFDPREAYRLCQKFPSSTANVVRAMLLKVGRPHQEVEQAVNEACQREGTRLYANVRWLNLAAAVAPLMGLLGTVWGMIQAFHSTTLLTEGQNKADHLAQGIYGALVTTLAGLAVAIPAAIVAHFFEGRIQSLMIQIEELLFHLLPQVERYEGRVRFSRQENEEPVVAPVSSPPPVQASAS